MWKIITGLELVLLWQPEYSPFGRCVIPTRANQKAAFPPSKSGGRSYSPPVNIWCPSTSNKWPEYLFTWLVLYLG